MRPPSTACLQRSLLAFAAGILLLVGLPATGGAQQPGVDSLRERSRNLQEQEAAALLELYALESRLVGARSTVARIRAQRAALAQRQASAARRYRAARRTLAVAQERLGAQLRLLYQADEPDSLTVILGATSLTDALEGLDSLNRTARATESVIDAAKEAKARVARERRTLARRQAAAARLQARADDALSSLLAASEQKSSYLAELRVQRRLNERQIAALEQAAREAQERAEQISPPAGGDDPDGAEPPAPTLPAGDDDTSESSDPGTPQENPAEEGGQAPDSQPPPPAPPPPVSGKQLRVVASAYCLKGTTATGLPVGPGIVAVDPSVIPLGTRMSVPGYGEGVAADTGGAIVGNRIDLWMSCPQANAYGLKTLTITLH